MIDLKRWETFSKRDQLGHIASEILRASLMEEKNQAIYFQIIERAIYFIDLSLEDKKWCDNPLPLLVLRDELAKAYIKQKVDLKKIYMMI